MAEWINPSELDTRTRHELWAGIKALEPALAELLTTDKNVTELKKAFNASVRFTRENAVKYVREGRKILEEKHNGQQ